MTALRDLVDPAVAELAASFISSYPRLNSEPNRLDLAREIQRAIEDWFEQHRPPDRDPLRG